jgi:hypothetical protein
MIIRPLCAFALLGIGCSSTEPKTQEKSSKATTAEKVVEPSKPVPTEKPVATLPADLAAFAPKATLQLGPFAWPKGGTSAIALNDVDMPIFVWKLGADGGQLYLPRKSAATAVRDVTGDGEPELVVFSAQPAKPLEWFDDHTMTWIIGVAPNKQPSRMWQLEGQVLGAKDEASLDRELAVTTFGASSDSSPVKLIARIPLATPAELQALVGAPGLKLCTQGKKRKCSTLPQKKIDAKGVSKILKESGVIAKYGLEDSEAEALQLPACELEGALIRCSASYGGPYGKAWLFEKVPTGLRLVEVGSWAEEM